MATEGDTVTSVLEKASDGLSPREAADRLGVTRQTIANWIKAGKLPATKFGGSIVKIDPADLEQMRRPA